MKEINRELPTSDRAVRIEGRDAQSMIKTTSAKRAFVEPLITLPVDVLKTTTAFLQGGSPGSATIP